MRIVREPVFLLGVFFVAAGIFLGQYGQVQGIGAAVPFGLLYVGAGTVMIALSLAPRKHG